MAVSQPSMRILLVALALGWSTDFIFYGKTAGISVPIFTLLTLAALFVLGRLGGVRVVGRNLWLLAPLLFFATMAFVRANPLLTSINILSVVLLLCLLLFFYAGGRIERLGLLGYPAVMAVSLGQMLVQPRDPVSSIARDLSTQRERVRLATPLVGGLLLALPVLALFTILLSSADSIFAGLVGGLFQLNLLIGLPETLWRQAIILAATWIIAGGLFFALSRRPEHEDIRSNPPGVWTLNRSAGFIEVATVMVLVDLLFAVFAWIQFTYLFFGQAAWTMQYEVYREYVRRGFGELLVVAVLTMFLIVGLRWVARKETAKEVRYLNLLSTIMIGLTLVILVSAFQRMLVWESVQFYINTPTRLYVRAFIAWLGLLFGWLLFALWSRQDRFAIGAFVAAIGFFVTMNLVNPDADVATYKSRPQG